MKKSYFHRRALRTKLLRWALEITAVSTIAITIGFWEWPLWVALATFGLSSEIYREEGFQHGYRYAKQNGAYLSYWGWEDEHS